MRSILILEDDNILRESIAEIVRMEGWSVIATGYSSEALRLTREELPALILSDINVPGLTGLEFFQKIQEAPQTAHIPFIFITASLDLASAQEETGLPIDRFVQKPFEVSRLVDMMHRLIDPFIAD